MNGDYDINLGFTTDHTIKSQETYDRPHVEISLYVTDVLSLSSSFPWIIRTSSLLDLVSRTYQ